MSFLRVAPMLAALFLCGCAETLAYRPEDVPDTPIPYPDRITGKILIYTTRTDDDRSITAGSTSLTGAGLKLTVPVGLMVREIALKVFSKAASAGADESDDFTTASRYSIALRPQIENFEYGFPHPKGVEVKPEVRMTLRISLLDATGRVLLEKDYDSGVVSGSRHLISGKLVERTDKLTHEVMFDLMQRAAADVHLYEQTQARAAAAN